MNRLISLIILSVIALSSYAYSPGDDISPKDLEGRYTIIPKTIENKDYRKYYRYERITLELRKGNIAILQLKYISRKDYLDNWLGYSFAQGTWEFENGNLNVSLNEIAPSLYPVKTKSNKTLFMCYPYCILGLLGDITFKVDGKPGAITLSTERLILKNTVCHITESMGRREVFGCVFTKTNELPLKTWQERVSQEMQTLPTDIFPRELNPLPTEISADSTLKILSRGEQYYDSVSAHLEDKMRISYKECVERYLLIEPMLDIYKSWPEQPIDERMRRRLRNTPLPH